MIRIACPKCKTAFKLADDLAGKRLKCKNCGTVIGVPVPAAAKAAVPVSALPTPPKPGAETITPYGVAPIAQAPEAAKDNRIDQMVRTAERQKRRNRAWNKVGMPATYMKWFTLALLAILTVAFLWWTMACVLMMHKWEQLERAGGDMTRKAQELRWIFPLDELFRYDDAVGAVFGRACAVYFPMAIICGLTLAGAESLRRLENYRWAMVGSCFGCIVFLPLGMLCVSKLLDKEVQYEFEISRMRREGVDWEKLEDEQLALEEAEAEEEDEEGEADDDDDDDAPRGGGGNARHGS